MPNPLDPNTIPKYLNQLVVPPVFEPTVVKNKHTSKVKSHNYRVTISQFTQQILPEGFPETTVWGYGSKVRNPETGEIIPDYRSAPGPTFEAIRHIPGNVQWINNLTEPYSLAVDPTIHWADPNKIGMPMPPFPPFPPGFPLAQSPVPIVTHLHGGETEPPSDGYPDAYIRGIFRCAGLAAPRCRADFGAGLLQVGDTGIHTGVSLVIPFRGDEPQVCLRK